jgi:peptidoglycan/xylan/chitin deacetylase (PgdA/CDA1 family)
MLSVGLALAMTGCASGNTATSPAGAGAGAGQTPGVPAATMPLPTVPPSHPGPSVKIGHGIPGAARKICLTVDDGDNPQVVAGYVEFARRTRIHLTFSPNGTYGHSWLPHADIIKPLAANGQVQIINHTFSHLDLRRMSDAQITAELERNDEWVQKNFGITTRPFYRPPFGFRNEHVDGVAPFTTSCFLEAGRRSFFRSPVARRVSADRARSHPLVAPSRVRTRCDVLAAGREVTWPAPGDSWVDGGMVVDSSVFRESIPV